MRRKIQEIISCTFKILYLLSLGTEMFIEIYVFSLCCLYKVVHVIFSKPRYLYVAKNYEYIRIYIYLCICIHLYVCTPV